MEKIKALKLIKKLKMEGYNASLYEDYSGRGMFGRTTFGVITDARNVSPKIKLRRDNLGLDYIYY